MADVRIVREYALDADERQILETSEGAIPLHLYERAGRAILAVLENPLAPKTMKTIVAVTAHLPSEDIYRGHYLGSALVSQIRWFYFMW